MIEEEQPVGREQLRDALGEAVRVRHVGEDVAGHHHAGAAVLLPHPPGRGLAEELHTGRDPGLGGDAGDVGRGLDTKDTAAAVAEPPEHGAIVGSDLDDEMAAQGAGGRLREVGDPLGMAMDQVRSAGDVDVVGEEGLGGQALRDLHEAARRTEVQVERDAGLGQPAGLDFPHLHGGEEAVRGRLGALMTGLVEEKSVDARA